MWPSSRFCCRWFSQGSVSTPRFSFPHPGIRAFFVCRFRLLRFSPWGRGLNGGLLNFIGADTPIHGFRSFVSNKGFNLSKVRLMTPSCFSPDSMGSEAYLVSVMPDSEDWRILSYGVLSLWMSCHRFAAPMFKELSQYFRIVILVLVGLMSNLIKSCVLDAYVRVLSRSDQGKFWILSRM